MWPISLRALGLIGGHEAMDAVIPFLSVEEAELRSAAIGAIGNMGDQSQRALLWDVLSRHPRSQSGPALIALSKLGVEFTDKELLGYLCDIDGRMKQDVLAHFASIEGPQRMLMLSRDLDGMGPWIDESFIVTDKRLERASNAGKMSKDEASRIYQNLKSRFGFSFEEDEGMEDV